MSSGGSNYADEGLRLVNEGRLEKAVGAFRFAIQHDRQNSSAHYNLALTLDMLDKKQDAKKAYERTVELAPENIEARINLAALLLELNDARTAVRHLKKAAKITDDPLVHYNLGCAYLALDDPKAAEIGFKEAYKNMPDDLEVIFNYALATETTGNTEAALMSFQKFIELAGDGYVQQVAYAQSVLEKKNDMIDDKGELDEEQRVHDVRKTEVFGEEDNETS